MAASAVISLDARRAARAEPDWSTLAFLNSGPDKRDAICMGRKLGMHVILLHGVDEAGVCTCGRPKCVGSSRGKHPVDSKWQIAPFNFDRVDAGLLENHLYNIGWRMGPQPNGSTVVCFDVDGPRSLLDPLEAKFGKLPDTLSASSGRGLHLFFRLSAGSAVPGNVKLGGIKEIDIRSTGGQVVIAPSRHYSGALYKWTNCIEPAEITL